MQNDQKFNFSLQLTLGLIGTAKIKMKCFTEIRDNQKINHRHAGFFGGFGVLMKEDWMIRSGGCPVIYAGKEMTLTNVLARNLGVMTTLNECVQKLAGFRSLYVNGAFFDLLSFVEVSENRYEYEWRVASGHKFGGKSFLPEMDRLKFSFADVHSLFVPDEDARKKTLESRLPEKSGHF